MGEFAKAFRKAREESQITLRKIKEVANLSIGFLSEMENGKRNPPEIPTVEIFEKLLGVTDGHLVKLAKKERVTIPTDLGMMITVKPELRELLLRADAMPRPEFDKFLNQIREASSDDDDILFYLNNCTLRFNSRSASEFAEWGFSL